MGTEINPENKCSELKINDENPNNKLEIIMNMQSDLQKFYYGKSLKDFDDEAKVKQTKEMILCIVDELMELMERTPWKHWKKYKDFSIKGDDLKELQFEIIDILHFYINLCELWGVDAKKMYNMYVSKNKENYDRQKRGY